MGAYAMGGTVADNPPTQKRAIFWNLEPSPRFPVVQICGSSLRVGAIRGGGGPHKAKGDGDELWNTNMN